MCSEKETREKTFSCRNSLLDEIFEHPRTKNLYNVYLIVLTGLFFQTVAQDYVKTGRVTLGLGLVRKGFYNFDKAVFIWSCCLGSACVCFFVFKIWCRLKGFAKEATMVSNWCGGTLLLLYYFYSFKLVGHGVRQFNFNPPCTTFVTIESVRFLMKVHSFVRNKATEADPALKFSNFLYFLFAPTLIYRDHYPRTKTTNWKFVARCFLQCLSVLFIFTVVIMNSYPTPEQWCQKFTPNDILLIVMEKLPYGILVVTGIFFLIFHSVQNLFAEILRFGDRLFYQDWWNAYSFSIWLSKWNKIVQDWLYYYVYRDFREFVCDNGALAKLVVFVVSFGVHEWIMYSWIGGFFPVMFVIFMGVVFPLTFCEFPKWTIFNILVWFCGVFFINLGLLLCAFEHYALLNAPLENPALWELVCPRFITCDCVLR